MLASPNPISFSQSLSMGLCIETTGLKADGSDLEISKLLEKAEVNGTDKSRMFSMQLRIARIYIFYKRFALLKGRFLDGSDSDSGSGT